MKDKNLDKILKQLGDFDPQAKPDWEAFVADNKSRINTEGKIPGNGSGKGILAGKATRYAGAFMVAVTGLLVAWYFAGSPVDPAQPADEPAPQKTEVTADQPEEAEVPVVEPKEVTPVTETSPEDLLTESQEKDQVQPLATESEPAKTEITDSGNETRDNDKAELEKPEQEDTVIITDTVFMKKTIYVTDTVKRK